ncbi:MAG: aldo/keto reductase [Lentisphaerae bacterium]|nr:aldo/keto reductase [Lentisphaerota bacterium]
MQYRRYGRTDLKISVLTLGTMRIPFNEDTITAEERAEKEANAVATVRAAMDAGINHIDTARGYGNSERLVGLALKELGREHFVLSTKISIQPSRDKAREQIDTCLRELGVDHIDVLDLHGINDEETLKVATSPDGCLKAVQEAIENGSVSHAAFSAHAGPEIVIPAMNTGLFSAASLLFWWTYQRHAPSVTRAAELDMGILTLSTSEKGGLLFHTPPRLVEACHPFSPLTLTHRWLLAQPGVTTLAVGPANPDQLAPHLEAVKEAAVNPQDYLADGEAEALERWVEAEKQALGPTRCTVCFRCLPCPKDVNIPEILRLRNLGTAFDMSEFGKMRYNLLGSADNWFPGQKADQCNRCGDCLPRCPENLAIPDLLEDTHAMLLDRPRKRLWEC